MRLISVAHTADQVLDRSKDVTRRLGWLKLRPGTILQPVRQAQGLKKGQKVEPIGGPVVVRSVRRERLNKLLGRAYGDDEARREGFPQMSGRRFLEHYCETFGVTGSTVVTRIVWEYLELPPFGLQAPRPEMRPLPFEDAHV